MDSVESNLGVKILELVEESLGVTIKKKRSRIRKSCNRCGREAHSKEEVCPAYGVHCRKCDRVGHYARVCKSKKDRKSTKEENNTMVEVEEMFALTSSSLGKTVEGDPTQEGLSRGGGSSLNPLSGRPSRGRTMSCRLWCLTRG